MTVEEKRKAIEKVCDSYTYCSYNQDTPCPLYNISGGCYELASDSQVESNYKILVGHGLITDESTTTVNETDTEDIINHPNHYTNGGMECIDEMLLVFGRGVVANFCLCNAWKYRYRALHKNGQEDIDKSHWYMAKYKELVDEVIDYGTIEF